MSDCAAFATDIAAMIILTFFGLGAVRQDRAQMWNAGVLAIIAAIVVIIDILT